MSTGINIASRLPYKVFTALLTQSGGDDPLSIDTGLLTIGVTYYINNDSSGMDFTNVGAPNNIAGASTYFVATGTTPNSWGAWEGTGNATLRYNTGAPVATVLENTIGNIWFTYVDVGQYLINSNGVFLENKTYSVMPQLQIYIGADEGGLSSLINIYRNENDNEVRIYSSNSSKTLDDTLFKTPIEIRVYN